MAWVPEGQRTRTVPKLPGATDEEPITVAGAAGGGLVEEPDEPVLPPTVPPLVVPVPPLRGGVEAVPVLGVGVGLGEAAPPPGTELAAGKLPAPAPPPLVAPV